MEDQVKRIDRLINEYNDKSYTHIYIHLWGQLHLFFSNYTNTSLFVKKSNMVNRIHLFDFLSLPIECLRLIIQHSDGNINHQDESGDTLLHKLAQGYRLDETIEKIDLFVEYGARVDIINNKGKTPLMEFIHQFEISNYNDKNTRIIRTMVWSFEPAKEENKEVMQQKIIDHMTNLSRKQQLLFNLMFEWFDQYNMPIYDHVEDDEFTLHDDYHPDPFSQDKE